MDLSTRTLCSAALALSLAACSKDAPAPPASAAPSASFSGKPPTLHVVPGARTMNPFNPFFPPDGVEGTQRFFRQEQPGLVQVEIQKEGTPLAVLTISDTQADERTKYQSSSDAVKGFPLVLMGNTASAVLVRDRLQVKIAAPGLDADARKAWLDRFDLAGLARP